MHRCSPALPFLLTFALLALGCHPSSASTSVAPPPPPPASPTAEQALSWVLARLEHGPAPSEAEVRQLFAPSFLAAVPAPALIETFEGLADQLRPIRVVTRTGTPPREQVARLDTAAGPTRATIVMTESEPRQISGLLFAPVSAAAPPTSYEEAREALTKAGKQSQLFVAALTADGRCVPRFAHAEREPMAIGSTFKLWVLAALDSKLRTEGVSWDRKIAIREALKAPPSGDYAALPEGTERSLRALATEMIARSDNTATDHLLDFVGREAVERAQRDTGHASPERNVPWLTTRELFALKTASDAEVAAYERAGLADKRARLSELARRPLALDQIGKWQAPRRLSLEWFASAHDVCGALSTLASRAQRDPTSTLLRVLGENPGLPVSGYRYIGYKGGSEPGVLHLSGLLQRADGRWFVVVVAVNDDQKALDEGAIVEVARGVLQLLAKPEQPE